MSKITLEPNSSGAGTFSIVSPDSDVNRTLSLPDSSGELLFKDTNGRVGIGTNNPEDVLTVSGAGRIGITESSAYGQLSFGRSGASLGSHIIGDANGNIRFHNGTNLASTSAERMRIDSSGRLLVGTTNFLVGSNSTSTGYCLNPSESLRASRSNGPSLILNRINSTGNLASFRFDGSQVGTISVTSSSTSYNTSSDYRLKENVTELSDGIERLKSLPVHRFNFIADPETTVDGFIAHEIQPYVPEAVTGEKDAVDENGNPEYQGIDQAKLVPVLTAALQEAVAKIEQQQTRIDDLVNRVTELENGA